MFDPYESIPGLARPYQFIELRLYRRTITILGVLNQKHHEKRDDRSASVDHQLPAIGILKQRAGNGPHENHRHAESEGERFAGHMSDILCKLGKSTTE
jgi:hypothetical protein